jgi:hypothetical protein
LTSPFRKGQVYGILQDLQFPPGNREQKGSGRLKNTSIKKTDYRPGLMVFNPYIRKPMSSRILEGGSRKTKRDPAQPTRKGVSRRLPAKYLELLKPKPRHLSPSWITQSPQSLDAKKIDQISPKRGEHFEFQKQYILNLNDYPNVLRHRPSLVKHKVAK